MSAAGAEVADTLLQEQEPLLTHTRNGGEEERQRGQKEEGRQRHPAATEVGDAPPSGPTWRDIGVNPKLAKALHRVMGLELPNELQVASMRPILKGYDTVLSSYTGSGKTLAGLLPLVQRLMANMPLFNRGRLPQTYVKEKCQPLLLVVAPSKGLCFQIRRVLEELLSLQETLRTVDEEKFMTYQPEETMVPNRVGLLLQSARPDIVVARLGEVLGLEAFVEFDFLQCVMFDEVDKLLDEESEKLQSVLKLFPAGKVQKVLASASALAHPRVDSFLRILQPNYRIIDSNFKCVAPFAQGLDGVEALSVPPGVIHCCMEVRRKDGEWASKRSEPQLAFQQKLEMVRRVVQRRGPGEFIVVFASHTKGNLVKLTKGLQRLNVAVHGLNEALSKDFSKFKLEDQMRPVILAQDSFAARGLDCESVTVVINFDLPMSYKNYAHRAGRTGRAGREGLVISLVSNQKEERFLRTTLSKLGSPTLHLASLRGSQEKGYWVHLDSPPEA